MTKNDIIDFVQQILDGKEVELPVIDSGMNNLFMYYYRTAIRVKYAYVNWKNNDIYWNDFLMAFRDFLLLFNTSMRFADAEIPSENTFAIRKNEETGNYYSNFQFPSGVNNHLAEQAYMRNLNQRETGNKYNLMTNAFIYSLTGFRSFKSLDQKLAVYGALNTPDGYTSLISLPTGGGKSLITQMLAYQSSGLTVVVVPTVSLADDQVIEAKKILKRSNSDEEIFLYKSGTDITLIRASIKEKKARLLFISPESLLNNVIFEELITEANQQHYLKNIVVDEAHIVIDWGASFRVDYQCLEAWRRKLLFSNPSIRTILLSATFEESSVKVLKSLFSDKLHWIEIRCDSLRHEPRYMLIKEKTLKEKEQKTLELAQKLPHPMIIYVARPVDADNIVKLLRNNGINNVHSYTGLTKSNERETLLKGWKQDQFEIMVATSAFGVGVDKPDVRTVLHLYVPQNPNAYYQELGRGGRDKLPCLSVMCIYPEDTNITFQRINKRVMTSDKIVGRWNSMYNNKRSKRNGEVTHIDTAIKPSYNEIDEWDDRPTSDADMNWNIYVLLLFRRYELINIISITIDKGIYIFSIKIIDDRIRMEGTEQTSLIEKIRSQEWNYYKNSYDIISSAIRSSREVCWSEMFFETYDKAYEYCGGCNTHDDINNGDAREFSLKKNVTGPLKDLTLDQLDVFQNQMELAVFVSEDEQVDLINTLEKKRLSVLIADEDQISSMGYFEHIHSNNNLLIMKKSDVHELLSRAPNLYYISGLIAIVYPDSEKEVLELFRLSSNYLIKNGLRVIHILKDNTYLSSMGKNITDLIDGRIISMDILCS